MADTPLSRWLHEEMPRRGYPLEGPRAGGTSRLADAAGISRAAMSRIINGQGDPTPDSLRRIGRVLGRSLGEMMVIAEIAAPEEMTEPSARISQVQLNVPAPQEDGSVVISVGGTSALVRVAPDEPEPDPEAILKELTDDGKMTDDEWIIWAMRRVPWQSRITAIVGMRAGIRAAQADAGRPRPRQTPDNATQPDIGHASSDS